MNVINQLVIGAKDGIVEAITKLVGSNITNAILQTADGRDHKSINNFMLFNVLQVAIDGADRPSTNDLLEQLIIMIIHAFDFCKKVRINMELMQSNAAQLTTYSIIVGIPQLTLTLLANIEMVAKSDYGLKSRAAMHAIQKKYTYNHVNDAMLLQVILTELAGANGVQVLKDVPAPSAGAVHSVADSISYLYLMMNGDTDLEYTKLVYGASTNSNSLEEECKPHRCDCKKSQCSKLHRGCEKNKKDKDDGPKKNTCSHCKKSIAGNPIASTQTSACGTRSTRAISSS